MREINKIAEALFEKIRDRFEDVSLGDENAKATQNPEDARFFNFDYVVDGESHGNITMSLIDENSLKIYFSKNMTSNLDEPHKADWYSFLRELREFARRNLLSFEPRDITRGTLKHRDVQTVSKADSTVTKDEVVTESRMYGTLNRSYESFGPVRIKIAHSKPIVDETKGGRSRNIQAIYVENDQGERFRMPFNSIVGARAMARHVSAGGVPTDEIGQHITGIVNEMLTLRPFVHSMRHRTFEDVETVEMLESAFEYHGLLKNTLKKLKGKKGYTEFKENFKPMIVETETDVEDIKEKFVKKVFPDKLAEALPIVQKAYEMKKADNNPLLKTFEDWANKLSEGTWAVPDDEEQQRELMDLMSKPLPVGVDAANATGALYNLIGDDTLYDELGYMAEQDPEEDARGIVADWLMDNGYEQLVPDEFKMTDTTGAAMGGQDGVVTESNDSFEAVQAAIIRRIIHSHVDIVKEFGPDAIMHAAEDTAAFVGDVEEIGTSDVSAWTRQTIESLQRGDYDSFKPNYNENVNETQHHQGHTIQILRKIPEGYKGQRLYEKILNTIVKNYGPMGKDPERKEFYQTLAADVMEKYIAKHKPTVTESSDMDAASAVAKIIAELISDGHTEVSPDVIMTKVSALLGRPFMLKDLVAANNRSQQLQRYISSINPTKIKFSTDLLTVKNENPVKKKEAAQTAVSSMASRAANRPRLGESKKNLSELSPELRGEYSRAAQKDMARHATAAKIKRSVYGADNPQSQEHEKRADKRERGLARASKTKMNEDRDNLEQKKILVRRSDSIDYIITKLDAAKNYQAAGRGEEAQRAISDAMSEFTGTFDGKIPREQFEDVLVPLDWCENALESDNWDRTVMNQTIDISLNLLDQMNDQIWSEIMQPENDEEEGGFGIGDLKEEIAEASLLEQGVSEGIEIVDQDSDLDQQVYTLNVDGNKVSFTYWDYENNFQSPDIKDIYQQAAEQLGRKLSPDQIKDVARAVFKSFEQGVAEGTLKESGETYTWTAEFADGSREQLTITTDEVPYAKAAFEKKFPNKELVKVDTDWKPVSGSYYSGMPTTSFPDRRPTEPYGRDVDNPMVREMKKTKLRGTAGRMVESFAAELDSIAGAYGGQQINERMVDVDGFRFEMDYVIEELRAWFDHLDTGEYLDDTTAEHIEHALSTGRDHGRQLWAEMQQLPRQQFARVIGQIVNFASQAEAEEYAQLDREQEQRPRITQRADDDDEEGGISVGELREELMSREAKIQKMYELLDEAMAMVQGNEPHMAADYLAEVDGLQQQVFNDEFPKDCYELFHQIDNLIDQLDGVGPDFDMERAVNEIGDISDTIERLAGFLSSEPDEEGGISVGDIREGQMKKQMHSDAEHMSLEAFCNKYGDESWVKEFWNNINELDEGWEDDMDDFERIDRELAAMRKNSGLAQTKSDVMPTPAPAAGSTASDDELDGNPHEMGYRAAALYSKGKNSNPFEYDDPRHDEWLDGWREGSTYEDGFFEGSKDDEVAAARAAQAKIDKPAVFRKQEKFLPSKGDDWKVSHQDLEKAGSLHSKEFDARKKAAGLDEALADMRRLAGLK